MTNTISHNGDTILIVIPASRTLNVNDEIEIFTPDFSKATGEVVVKCQTEDGTDYVFDTSTLNTDGKVRVIAATSIAATFADDAVVNVYTLDGICLRTAVRHDDALNHLPAGSYIIGFRTVDGRLVGRKEVKR